MGNCKCLILFTNYFDSKSKTSIVSLGFTEIGYFWKIMAPPFKREKRKQVINREYRENLFIKWYLFLALFSNT